MASDVLTLAVCLGAVTPERCTCPNKKNSARAAFEQGGGQAEKAIDSYSSAGSLRLRESSSAASAAACLARSRH
jgi:hypothetical protein